MNNFLRYAYLWFPALMLLKDILATVVMLSNEPGISEANAFHYQMALLPGSFLGGVGVSVPINIVFGAAIGMIVSVVSKAKARPQVTGN